MSRMRLERTAGAFTMTATSVRSPLAIIFQYTASAPNLTRQTENEPVVKLGVVDAATKSQRQSRELGCQLDEHGMPMQQTVRC